MKELARRLEKESQKSYDELNKKYQAAKREAQENADSARRSEEELQTCYHNLNKLRDDLWEAQDLEMKRAEAQTKLGEAQQKVQDLEKQLGKQHQDAKQKTKGLETKLEEAQQKAQDLDLEKQLDKKYQDAKQEAQDPETKWVDAQAKLGYIQEKAEFLENKLEEVIKTNQDLEKQRNQAQQDNTQLRLQVDAANIKLRHDSYAWHMHNEAIQGAWNETRTSLEYKLQRSTDRIACLERELRHAEEQLRWQLENQFEAAPTVKESHTQEMENSHHANQIQDGTAESKPV
ncbi:hypothetical protein FPOAC2_08743 [Fusarium poae]